MRYRLTITRCFSATVKLGADVASTFALTRSDWLLIVHFTRNWLHYGAIAFISGCVLIGALRGAISH